MLFLVSFFLQLVGHPNIDRLGKRLLFERRGLRWRRVYLREPQWRRPQRRRLHGSKVGGRIQIFSFGIRVLPREKHTRMRTMSVLVHSGDKWIGHWGFTTTFLLSLGGFFRLISFAGSGIRCLLCFDYNAVLRDGIGCVCFLI